jgi:hypothetical protein
LLVDPPLCHASRIEHIPELPFVQRARDQLARGNVDKAVRTLAEVRYTYQSQVYWDTFEGVRDTAHEALRLRPGHAKAQALLDLAEHALAKVGERSEQPTAEEVAKQRIQERLAAIASSTQGRDLVPAVVYEYDVLEVSPRDARSVLAQAGSLGWELVGVTALSDVSDPRERLFVKRLVGVAQQGQQSRAVAGASGVVGFAYFESGLDTDFDGDVDGGLIDHLQGLFD